MGSVHIERASFPIFGLSWSPSALAYCGGGGSSRTGVKNFIMVVHYDQSPPPPIVTEDGDVLQISRRTCQRVVEINTEDRVCISVALHPWSHMVPSLPAVLAGAVGDDVVLYDASKGNVVFSYERCSHRHGRATVEQPPDSTETPAGPAAAAREEVCTVAFSKCGQYLAAGCEDGTVLCFALQVTSPQDQQEGAEAGDPCVSLQLVSACHGHTAPVCSLAFKELDPPPEQTQQQPPPQVPLLLSSAKDGTARLWQTSTGACTDVLPCSNKTATQTNTPPPDQPSKKPMSAAAKRVAARAKKIMVRGCAFGHNGTIYAVASAQRGAAVLTTFQPLLQPGPPGQPPQWKYVEQARLHVSDVPVSSLSMSSNQSTLHLGTVEGRILVIDCHSLKVKRQIEGIHDLPVTALASRPSHIITPNNTLQDSEYDEEGPPYFDTHVISTSADSKVVHVCTNRRKLKRPRRRRKGEFSAAVWVRNVSMVMVVLMGVCGRLGYERCGGYVKDVPLGLVLKGLVMDHAAVRGTSRGGGNGTVGWEEEEEERNVEDALYEWKQCLVQTWIAPPYTPGIAIFPH